MKFFHSSQSHQWKTFSLKLNPTGRSSHAHTRQFLNPTIRQNVRLKSSRSTTENGKIPKVDLKRGDVARLFSLAKSEKWVLAGGYTDAEASFGFVLIMFLFH